MTASLPVPHEPPSDDALGGETGEVVGPRPVPPKPSVSAAAAAADSDGDTTNVSPLPAARPAARAPRPRKSPATSAAPRRPAAAGDAATSAPVKPARPKTPPRPRTNTAAAKGGPPSDGPVGDPAVVTSDAETPDAPVTPTPRPAKKSAPRPRKAPARAAAATPRAPEADPGPPPPLPADVAGVEESSTVEADGLVVPPRPPLPAESEPVESAAEPEIDAMPEPVAPETAPEAVATEAAAPEAAVGEAAPDVVEPVTPTVTAPAETVPDLVAPEAVAPEVAETEIATSGVAPMVASAESGPLASARISLDGSVPALSVRGVTKSFAGTRAVDGIDLTVPAGTFYGLVGPNGAGKTTTLSMIAGLLQPDRGTISVNGVDAAAAPRAAKRLMGVLPDRLRTFDRLTGRQLLYYCGVLRGLDSAVVESRTADLARAFDLADALGRPVSDYSAGMTKKVMLAGAMIHSPRLLVLDEPFEAVDPVSSAVILDILSAYVAHGGTVILSSHGMDLVERVCSRVAVIVAGQVLAEGTIDEVRGELTLEQRFIELAGGLSDVEGLEWLHTFSG